jgi:hypothetical protein
MDEPKQRSRAGQPTGRANAPPASVSPPCAPPTSPPKLLLVIEGKGRAWLGRAYFIAQFGKRLGDEPFQFLVG